MLKVRNFWDYFSSIFISMCLAFPGQFEFGNRIYEVPWDCLFHAVFPAWAEVHFLKDLERKSVLFLTQKLLSDQRKPSVLLVRLSSQPKFANLW